MTVFFVMPMLSIISKSSTWPIKKTCIFQNKRRCMVPSDITQCTEKMYYAGSTLKNENSDENYYVSIFCY